MGVLRDLAYEYLTPITATNGQSGGFIVTDIVPLLMGDRRVLYIGDYELRGPADQIEQNTKRYIEEHTGRTFGDGEWTKIALTEKQVNASVRLQRLPISKLDKRHKPAKEYEAIECEALGQGVLVRLSADTSTACCPSHSHPSASVKPDSGPPCAACCDVEVGHDRAARNTAKPSPMRKFQL